MRGRGSTLPTSVMPSAAAAGLRPKHTDRRPSYRHLPVAGRHVVERWVLAWFEQHKQDEDWPIYALGYLALALLFLLLLVVALRLLFDALGIVPL